MNAFSSEFSSIHTPDWPSLDDKVHLWRAKCMNCYTDAEYAISETIVVLRKSSGNVTGFKPGYLFGHKIAELAATFAQAEIKTLKRTCKAARSLEQFQQQAGLRNTLNHGAMTVYSNREGSWVAEFKMISFADTESTTSRTFFDEPLAQEMLAGLRSAVQSLATNLQHFRTELKGACDAPPVTPSAPPAQASR